MKSLEKALEDYTNLKINLIKSSQCIKSCNEESEIEEYQDLCISYATEIKELKKVVKDTYGINLCVCHQDCIEQD
ncbi:hypothetical protein M3685_12425 [Heyndrickxia oleronia]|uniref:Uncharacterized protein n=1 Tax=Heyndrickxia oleronia TaxID=38875 RepID=A0A8E2LDM6_9BACI|nr:hypothetical protein [Heyndrickxia oleronia]OJH17062.1 hypothetical protein BLX88_20310 [Bacillus obstructivus]MCM3454728.1 hypothetical protein [Heyndrickxia oleronia]MEC1373798.1 hypothetical protein [Heyndrickxia oleronia]OOP66279.1 hypothetical protein BWZ43_21835 [Heyndrickxia oleronia]QQZ05388.1 hypothetical protein I5818_02320 [Heyndrickxia oleronia]